MSGAQDYTKNVRYWQRTRVERDVPHTASARSRDRRRRCTGDRWLSTPESSASR
jgi:hypothetical protein